MNRITRALLDPDIAEVSSVSEDFTRNPIIWFFIASIVTIFASVAYGALGPLLPFIVIKVGIAVFAITAIHQCFANCSRSLVIRLAFAVFGAVLGVAGLWFGWIWQEFGFTAATDWLMSGPQAAYASLARLAPNYIYEISRRGTGGAEDVFITYVIWWSETALFFATPFVGAFVPAGAEDSA